MLLDRAPEEAVYSFEASEISEEATFAEGVSGYPVEMSEVLGLALVG